METLKFNDKSESVRELQKILLQWGCDLPKIPTTFFGNQTLKAVSDFQKHNGFVVNGVVDDMLWRALKRIEQLKLKEEDFIRAATFLNVEVEVIKTVQSVETGKYGGFFISGKPTILFERHIFYRQLKNRNIDPENYTDGNDDILSSGPGGYVGGIREYERLNKAIKIDETAALASASWGLFQIMGFNYKVCGCMSVKEFTDKMCCSEGMQLDLFVNFIKENKLDSLLREHNWAGFAKRYNGANYSINNYDKKLEQQYEYYKSKAK